jgi:hypothetical protein
MTGLPHCRSDPSQKKKDSILAPSMSLSTSKGRKEAKAPRCHFDPFGEAQDKLREKSFSDPSHSLGMTGLSPSPWRPWRSLREIQSFPLFSSSEKFKYVWLGFIFNRAAFTSIGQSDRRAAFIRSGHFMLSRNSTNARSRSSTRINPKRGYSISRMT